VSVPEFSDTAADSSSPFVSDAGGLSSWTPIPELQRKDGDTSLFLFTANSVEYEQQVLDPFFLAQYNDSAGGYYQPSYPVSAMACVDQFVIRNNAANLTTAPHGINALAQAVEQLKLNTAQMVTAQRLLVYLANTNTFASVYSTGSNALKASDAVLGLLSNGLPPEQWRTEVEGWFETSLTKLQAYAVEYADVTANLGPGGAVQFPLANTTSESEWIRQCNNQKISNTGQYQTFSFFGLMFTLVFGMVIILVALMLQCIVSKISRRKGGFANSRRELALVADDKFQLQRMVYENTGSGDWQACDEGYPWDSIAVQVPNPILRGDTHVIYTSPLDLPANQTTEQVANAQESHALSDLALQHGQGTELEPSPASLNGRASPSS
jgi:hypothetical protein